MRDTWMTVTSTPQQIIGLGAGSTWAGAEIMVRNPGPVVVWVGKNSANLGVSTGVPVYSGEAMSLAFVNEALYIRHINADADQTVYILATGTGE